MAVDKPVSADTAALRELIAVLAKAMGIPPGFGRARPPVPHSLGYLFPDTPGIVHSDSRDLPPTVPLAEWARLAE